MCFLLLDIQAAGLQLRMDERVKHCITQLSEVQRHAKMFVKSQLFAGQQLPSSLNRRYFPTRRGYHESHIQNADRADAFARRSRKPPGKN
jgi:hypothetical protein